MKKSKQKLEYPFRKATLKDFASGFSDYSKSIDKQLGQFAHRQNDPKVALLYLRFRHTLGVWGEQIKEYFPNSLDLPAMPELNGNDYYAGLIRLKEYSEKAARETVKEKMFNKPGETMPQMKTEYSMPLAWNKWAYWFGVSPNKLRELRENNTYHFVQVSKRLWVLPKHELPAEYLEKYRHTATKS
jgi:hypothetical protein